PGAGPPWPRIRAFHSRLLKRVVLLLSAALLLAAVAGAAGGARRAVRAAATVEVVVTLPQPPLAEAVESDRGLAAAVARGHRIDLRAPASVSYLRTLARAQRT